MEGVDWALAELVLAEMVAVWEQDLVSADLVLADWAWEPHLCGNTKAHLMGLGRLEPSSNLCLHNLIDPHPCSHNRHESLRQPDNHLALAKVLGLDLAKGLALAPGHQQA